MTKKEWVLIDESIHRETGRYRYTMTNIDKFIGYIRTNGCGAKHAQFVPDLLFYDSCVMHDLMCGAFYLEMIEDSWCDIAGVFYHNMLEDIKQYKNETKKLRKYPISLVCYGVATVYYLAVIGQGVFNYLKRKL